jgi:hypothetical protein
VDEDEQDDCILVDNFHRGDLVAVHLLLFQQVVLHTCYPISYLSLLVNEVWAETHEMVLMADILSYLVFLITHQHQIYTLYQEQTLQEVLWLVLYLPM